MYFQMVKGKSLVMHCAFLTAHNKIAAVKKSIRSNIIKMKLTEEKHYWNFHLRLFLSEMTLCVGNVSSTSSGEP